MNLSDMITMLYVSESTLLRVQKMEAIKGEVAVTIYKHIVDVLIYDAAGIIMKSGFDAVYSYAEEDQTAGLIDAIKMLTTVNGVNVKEARRAIADKLIEDNQYKF